MNQPEERNTYILDRGQTDQERLTRMARSGADLNREMCLRAGLRPGDRAIDVGCGPLGAMPGTTAARPANGTAAARRPTAGHRLLTDLLEARQ